MENRIERLIASIKNTTVTHQKWCEVFNNIESYNYEEKKLMLRNGSNITWYYHERAGLQFFFVEHNVEKAKHHFYTCGVLDEYQIINFNTPLLDYGLNHFSYALLSDNIALINRYANFTHSYYDKSIKNGGATPVYVIQCLIKEDWAEFERAMAIMRTKTLKKYPRTMFLDIALFEGIAEKNKQKIEQTLAEFVTPKMHKMRNKLHTLLNEFISHPALGYAKLAWLKGIEVEVNSPLVPKELLPVKPLDTYINEYAFLDEIELPAK